MPRRKCNNKAATESLDELQLENTAGCVYSVAPGESSIPMYIVLDKDFSDQFPSGIVDFDTIEKRER